MNGAGDLNRETTATLQNTRCNLMNYLLYKQTYQKVAMYRVAHRKYC